jgi:hypothetical protein
MSENKDIKRISRREFMGTALTASAAFSFASKGFAGSSAGEINILKKGTVIKSPYNNVNWGEVDHVQSVTHYHCRAQEHLDAGYNRGIRHFAISNYYPSAPSSLEEKRNQWVVEHNHPIMHNGKLTTETINWNKVIMDPKTGWLDEIPEKIRKRFPMQVGGLIYPRAPKDIIISPNAEHAGFGGLTPRTHINSVGSMYASGHIKWSNYYKLPEHGYPYGTGREWRDAFRLMIDNLIFSDGGGLTINHPRWSNLTHEDICKMLDFDKEKVLGIEIWNHPSNEAGKRGWAIKEWDKVLATGRRCFGFCVSDHEHKSRPFFLGRNILLVNNFTEEECLKAYRQGRFYGALKGDSLRFKNISINNGKLLVETNNAMTIKFISMGEIIESVNDKTAEITLPSPSKVTGHNYVRVEAHDYEREIIFSNPIMIRTSEG